MVWARREYGEDEFWNVSLTTPVVLGGQRTEIYSRVTF